MIQGKPVFIEFKCQATIGWMDASDIKMPYYEKFEAFAQEKRDTAPEGLKYLEQMAPLAWVWMPSEQAFVSSAIQGMAIAIAFAFAILLLATWNIILAIYSILCVSIVIVSVVGIMHMLGW